MSHVLGKAPANGLVPVWNGTAWTHQVPPIIAGEAQRATAQWQMRANFAVGSTIALSDPITALTFDGTSLWCVSSAPDTLRKFDPITGAPQGTLALGVASNLISAYKGYDYTLNLNAIPAIWVIYTNGNADRVNPATLLVTHSFSSGDFVSGGAVTAVDSLWVGGTGGNIHRVRNPGTGAPTDALISLTGGASIVDDLTWDGQSIFVAYRTAGGLAGIDQINPTTNAVVRTTGAGALGSGNRLKIGWDGRHLWSFHCQTSPPSTIRKHDPVTLNTLQTFTVVEPGSATNVDIPNINYDLVWDGTNMWFPTTSGLLAWGPRGRGIQLLLRSGLGGTLPNPANPLHTAMYQTGSGQRTFAYTTGGGVDITRVVDSRPAAPQTIVPVGVRLVTISTLLVDAEGDLYISVNSVPLTVTLPAIPTTGREYIIKDVTGTASVGSPITVSASGGLLIDGSATRLLASQYEALRLVYNGTQWSVS